MTSFIGMLRLTQGLSATPEQAITPFPAVCDLKSECMSGFKSDKVRSYHILCDLKILGILAAPSPARAQQDGLIESEGSTLHSLCQTSMHGGDVHTQRSL